MHPWLRNAGKEFLQRVYFRDRFLWRLPAEHKAVALTFDDGPDPGVTPARLDLLAREGLKATFFVVGRNVQRYPEIARRLAREGHGLGGHTFDHREIPSLSPQELDSEMARCRAAIRDATAVDTLLFRPPRGKVDLRSMRAVCRLGYRLVHWTRTYSDYQCADAELLIERMRRDPVRPRDIVLLHDHNARTVAAIARMIPEWRTQGVVFEPL